MSNADAQLTAGDSEAEMGILERRWYAAHHAAVAARAECELLREMLELHETAWRRARSRQRHLEDLRECLSRQIGSLELPSRQTFLQGHQSVTNAA
jgi:hypothetical protein